MNSTNNFYATSPNRYSFLRQSRQHSFDQGDITQSQLDEWNNYIDECIRKDSYADPADSPSLEHDLRSDVNISTKCKNSEVYSQNLYAALCNNEFFKEDRVWSCSWRNAGGIVSNLREDGDYIAWYCSGIGSKLPYVGESVITDEIRKDIEGFGWKIIEHPIVEAL